MIHHFFNDKDVGSTSGGLRFREQKVTPQVKTLVLVSRGREGEKRKRSVASSTLVSLMIPSCK